MSTTLEKLPIGATVSFETYAPEILRTVHKQAVVVAHIDADSARQMGGSPYEQHAAIFPRLPAGTPATADEYLFLKLRLLNGQYDFVGLPWIKPETIVTSKRGRIVLVLEDRIQTDIQTAVQALSANDLPVASVSYDGMNIPLGNL